MAEVFLIRADPAIPGDVVVQRTDPFPFVIRVSQIEVIDLRPESGNDAVQALVCSATQESRCGSKAAPVTTA